MDLNHLPQNMEISWDYFGKIMVDFSQKHLRCLGSRLVTLAAGERD